MYDLQQDGIKKFILVKSMSDFLPNLIFWGIGIPIVIFLASIYWWLGVVGFAIYVIVLVIDVVRLIVVVGSGVIILFLGRRGLEAQSIKAQALSWGATLIQIVEGSVFSLYTFII
ncbi:MAG: hypothetical protein LDL07_08420 [Desulfarculus sp.]|nr:hypothetical protein [Desulfarculus sp.]